MGEIESSFTDEVRHSTTGGSRGAAERFAGLPTAQAALRFARARHAGQYREIDLAPFIDHAIEVGWLLRRDGQPDEVIAAGLLHDVLEKTTTTATELQDRFGPKIAWLVESVSDDPSIIDQRSRKRDLRVRVARADARTCAVFAADKIAKVRELAPLPASQLAEPKNRAKLAHYHASRKMLHRVAPQLTLLDQLDAELERLVAPTVVTRSRRVGVRTTHPIASRRAGARRSS